MSFTAVIPAKAGTHTLLYYRMYLWVWAPACAGVTEYD